MKQWWVITFILGLLGSVPAFAAETVISSNATPRKVFIIPVREDIFSPLTYVIRRGVKEAMAEKADLIVLDMETNGGSVGVTEEIIKIISQFPGETVTYVNTKAFSAGAFIAVGTQKIYMAPVSVIGAAAPIMMGPGGTQSLPDTQDRKMTSAVRALVRAQAEKNGHNVDVIEAMIDKTKEFIIDGEVLNKEGNILTLTNVQAEKGYGTDKKPLLSLGTVKSIEELITQLGYTSASVKRIEPTGVEQLAFWINAISPLLLIIGAVGVYIEFKTPGFGIPGIVGISAFVIYFLGGYVAGLSGMEWVAVFVLGLVLVAVEIFFFPGTIFVGLVGAAMMLASLVMAMVDIYPGMPSIPTMPQLQAPLMDLFFAGIGSVIAALVLARWLPKTSAYSALVSTTTSGSVSVRAETADKNALLGQEGVTLSQLRPGGKAQFGDRVIDVVTRGEMISKGTPVKIIGRSGPEAIVEAVG